MMGIFNFSRGGAVNDLKIQIVVPIMHTLIVLAADGNSAAALTLLISTAMRKLGWIHDGDMKLEL